MIHETFYRIGVADEGDEYYIEALESSIDRTKYATKEQAEQAIQNRLNSWGYDEGWTRADYDIAKITVTIERE